MLVAGLDADTVLAQQRKLCPLAHEHLEGVVVLVDAAVADEVGVKVQRDPHSALQAGSSFSIFSPNIPT